MRCSVRPAADFKRDCHEATAVVHESRFMAFGDSITAGEVTFPGSTSRTDQWEAAGRAVGGLSDSAIQRLLLGRGISSQGDTNHRVEPGRQR